jgi:hypothetical protein
VTAEEEEVVVTVEAVGLDQERNDVGNHHKQTKANSAIVDHQPKLKKTSQNQSLKKKRKKRRKKSQQSLKLTLLMKM